MRTCVPANPHMLVCNQSVKNEAAKVKIMRARRAHPDYISGEEGKEPEAIIMGKTLGWMGRSGIYPAFVAFATIFKLPKCRENVLYGFKV